MVKITWISPSLRCKTQHCEIPKMEYFRNGGELHIGPSLEIPEWILLLNMTKFPEIRSNLSSFNQFVDQTHPSFTININCDAPKNLCSMLQVFSCLDLQAREPIVTV